MPSGDSHLLVIDLIMIELLGTIFFLAIVTIFLYIKRYFVRKSLSGLKVLITNGDTDLSQELAEQLSKKHNCHVILVKANNVCHGAEAKEKAAAATVSASPQIDSISSKSPGISIFHCDILNNDDLGKFSQTVHNSFDGIDIVIDNTIKGIYNTIDSDDCRAFIDVTSEKLRTTISMLMHFVPKLKYSKCGHFVTIQPNISNKKLLLSSYGEIKSLINLLTDNQSTFALDLFNRQQKIHLTTIMWNCDKRNITTIGNGSCNENINNNNNGHVEIKVISERIIDGIKANRSVVNIHQPFNLIDSVCNYFQKKKTDPSRVNCNDHRKIR